VPSLAGPGAETLFTPLLASLPPLDVLLLECRLTGPNAQVDASIAVEAGDLDGRRRLWRWIEQQMCNVGGDSFRPLAALLRAWDSSPGLLADAVSRIWLEFDLVRGRTDALPGVFVGIRRGVTLEGRPCGIDRLAMAVLDPLVGAERAARFAPTLDAVLSELPAGAAVNHLGLFPNRPDAGLRLLIAFVTVEEAAAYLDRIGHPTSITPAASLLTAAGLLDHKLVLGIDIEAGLGSRIGLEVPVPSADPDQAVLRALMAALVSRKLCGPAQRDSALGWRKQWADEAEPTLLGSAPAPTGRDSTLRTVSHVKLGLSAEPGMEAKVYLTLLDPSGWRHGSRAPPAPAPDPQLGSR
jgi:hypothetical protein